MCKKASRKINVLKRISKILTQDSRKSICRLFIAADFSCPISWIFCGKKNMSKLEELQERGLRLVFCDQNSSYDDLLKRGNFLSLKAYRIKCLAVEVFKCVHEFNATYLNRLFIEPLPHYNFRDRRRLNQPKSHTYTYGFRSFRYSGSKLWNFLPRAIKNTNDSNGFKKNITEWCQTCDLSKLVSTFPIVILFFRGRVSEMFVTSYSLTYCIYIPGKLGFFIFIVQFMMSANRRIRYGLQIVFICLYITPSYYHM